MTDDADRAAKALIAAFRTLADSLPGMYLKQTAPGVISLMSGLPIGTLNGVFTDAVRPDVIEIDRAAVGLAGLPLPWSIEFRGEPEPAAERVAARYELTASRIVADGIARGSDLFYLQASADGYPLYESMGFRTVETWTYLMTQPG
jgi:hypothetical protein